MIVTTPWKSTRVRSKSYRTTVPKTRPRAQAAQSRTARAAKRRDGKILMVGDDGLPLPSRLASGPFRPWDRVESRNDLEPSPLERAQDVEVPVIEREHRPSPISRCEHDERGV